MGHCWNCLVLSHPHGRNTKIILASILDLRAVLTMISQILHELSNAYIFSHIHFVGEIHAVSYSGICIAILHHPGGAFDIWITQKYHIMFCWHVLKIRHKTFLCIYTCKDNNLFFYLRLTSSALRTNVIYSSMPISRRGKWKKYELLCTFSCAQLWEDFSMLLYTE